MALEVRSVDDARDFARFVDLPFRLYRDDPMWVAPLKDDVRLLFNRAKNPFFEHADIRSFLAWRDGRVVGRITAIENRAHNEFQGDRAGFFGFFECEDDAEAARALFDAAEGWLRERKLSPMLGPFNFSTNDDCGSLLEGFDSPPVLMMPYNPPYHAKLYEAAGLTKAKDLLAYFLGDNNPPERLVRAVELIRKRSGVTTRPMIMKRFDEELAIIRDIYNSAWEKNWGFVPMTRAEIDHMAKQLKPVVDPEMVTFAEIGGQTVGFALALPDFNVALKHAKGELFPFGFLQILWHKRKIDIARVITLGVKEAWRGQGIDALMYYDLFVRGRKRGYRGGEFSWILEDNIAMRRPLDNLGARPYKTYRIYERPVRGV